MRALSARYIAPGAGRRPDPVARTWSRRAATSTPSIPSGCPPPSRSATARGRPQLLLETHVTVPRTVALVLWGSDNIKSDGVPIAQALALMGAVPRFDGYGRLSGADLIPLAELGRPRIDVVMTLSGIFRDLLPLQTKMLAEAALEGRHRRRTAGAQLRPRPCARLFRRRWAAIWRRRACASSRTPKAPTARTSTGSSTASAFGDEDELADAFEARKSFAYGRERQGGQATPPCSSAR